MLFSVEVSFGRRVRRFYGVQLRGWIHTRVPNMYHGAWGFSLDPRPGGFTLHTPDRALAEAVARAAAGGVEIPEPVPVVSVSLGEEEIPRIPVPGGSFTIRARTPLLLRVASRDLSCFDSYALSAALENAGRRAGVPSEPPTLSVVAQEARPVRVGKYRGILGWAEVMVLDSGDLGALLGAAKVLGLGRQTSAGFGRVTISTGGTHRGR